MQYLLISVTLIVALAILSACASTVSPQFMADLQDQENRLASREKAWREKVDMFRAEATTLMVEAIMFSNHPGWSDMLQIIIVNTSVGTLEGEKQASLKFTTAIMQWSRKWQANGGDCSGDSGFDIDRAGDRFYTTGPNFFLRGAHHVWTG